MTTPGRSREAELAALAAQLRAPPPTPPEPPPAAPHHAAPALPPEFEEIQQALERLQSLAADGVAELDEAVAEHPWASVAAAFLLGLCVGRLLPRA